jgi:hypothetical protein
MNEWINGGPENRGNKNERPEKMFNEFYNSLTIFVYVH